MDVIIKMIGVYIMTWINVQQMIKLQILGGRGGKVAQIVILPIIIYMIPQK